MKKSLLFLCLTLAIGSIQLRAQDAKASLDAVSAALGAANLRSIEFSGRGFDGTFGQPYDANSPWPRFAVPAMTRPASRTGKHGSKASSRWNSPRRRSLTSLALGSRCANTTLKPFGVRWSRGQYHEAVSLG